MLWSILSLRAGPLCACDTEWHMMEAVKLASGLNSNEVINVLILLQIINGAGEV